VERGVWRRGRDYGAREGNQRKKEVGEV